MQETTRSEHDRLPGADQYRAPPGSYLDADGQPVIVVQHVGDLVFEQQLGAVPFGAGAQVLHEVVATRWVESSPPPWREDRLNRPATRCCVLGEVGVVVGIVDALDVQDAGSHQLFEGVATLVVERLEQPIGGFGQAQRRVRRRVHRGVGRACQVLQRGCPFVDQPPSTHDGVVADPQHTTRFRCRASGESRLLENDHRRSASRRSHCCRVPSDTRADNDDVSNSIPLTAPRLLIDRCHGVSPSRIRCRLQER